MKSLSRESGVNIRPTSTVVSQPRVKSQSTLSWFVLSTAPLSMQSRYVHRAVISTDSIRIHIVIIIDDVVL